MRPERLPKATESDPDTARFNRECAQNAIPSCTRVQNIPSFRPAALVTLPRIVANEFISTPTTPQPNNASSIVPAALHILFIFPEIELPYLKDPSGFFACGISLSFELYLFLPLTFRNRPTLIPML